MSTKTRNLIHRIGRSVIAIMLVIAMTIMSVPETVLAAKNTTTNSSTQAASQNAAVEKSIVVKTQKELDKALADANITKITIKTSAEIKLTIPNKSYKTKTLIVNGENLTVSNGGIFKAITITNAKTYTEKAKGNSITINDKELSMTISASSTPKSVTFAKSGTKSTLTINGTLKNLVISKKADLTLKGKTTKKVPVQITENGKDTKITSSIPVTISSETTAAKVTLKKGAENSTITLTQKTYDVTVANNTSKSIKVTTPEGKFTVKSEKSRTIKSEVTATPTVTPTPTPTVTPTPTEIPTVTPTPTPTTYYTVTFDSNGGSTLGSVSVAKGECLETLPTPQKDNSIFLGWYTDIAYQDKFTENTPVHTNLTLYAKYSGIEIEQQFLEDSYSLVDQDSSLSFYINSTDSSMYVDSVKNGITLTSEDGSEDVTLIVTGNNGRYQVTASEGFIEGASYTLILNDIRLNFQDKESNIRKCSFTIAKEEVYNITLNDGIVYIPSREITNITINGTSAAELSVPIVSMSTEYNGDYTANGTITYHGAHVLKAGDVLCIYSGELPQAPSAGGDDSQFMDDNIAYITVETVTGSVGNQTVRYADADATDVLFIPDVLPIDSEMLKNNETVTSVNDGVLQIASSDLDFSAFADMGLSSETTVDKGDFIAFYTGNIANEDDSVSVVYGEVTEIKENNGILTIYYQIVTEQQMQESLDYYSMNEVNPDSMLDESEIASIEADIEEQVIESGFAEDASIYLASLAMETDGFKNIAGENFNIESLSIQFPEDYDEELDAIQSLAISKVKIENLKVKADIGTSLKKLSGKGIRCAVTVSFNVPIKTGDDKVINIAISASFIEEIKLDVDASGKAIWKTKWKIFKYIDDYYMKANIDLYNYTGISFKAVVSAAETGSIDISEEIQNILSYTKSEEITAGVQDLFEIYSEMMDNETDWVEIFDKEISKTDIRLLLGVIHIRTTLDFVVSANVNVALGCNFEYKNGTRYCFWAYVDAKEAGNSQVSLMDETYSFQFYVVGVLGLRAGVRLEVAVGLLSVKLDSVGLIAEAGVYTKLYGFFLYQLDSVNKVKNSKTSGALLVDVGIYFDLSFKAQVLNGKYQYNPTLVAKEWPILSAGTRYYVYDFAYVNTKNTINLKNNVKSYTLPDSTFNMTYLDLREGDVSVKKYKVSDYNITFSNPNFTLSGNTVKVNVPSGVHQLDTTMTITWKSGALAFSSVPISRTYYITWDDINSNGYTITYQTNGGSQINTVTKKYNEKLIAPTNPVREGYTFDGWYSDEKLTNMFSFTAMPANNLLLYAKWNANTDTQYRVEHYQQNILNDNYTVYFTETLQGTTDTTVTAREKYFTGFVYDSSVKDTISTGKIEADGSLVLKLYYKRNSYSLTFKLENGGADITKTLKYGASISEPVVVKSGHAFQGWYPTISTTMPAVDVTYIASWTPNYYTIHFNPNGGSSVNDLTKPYGTTLVEPEAPTREGFEFVGWFSNEALTVPYIFTTMQSKNITVYAKWENINQEIPYTVEYYLENLDSTGYILADSDELYGSINSVVTAEEMSYDGFTYNGDVEGTITSGTLVADESLVLKLYYDRNSYRVTFKAENGEEDITTTVKYGASITTPTVVKEGYTFQGWDPTVSTTMPAEDVTYTAKWIVSYYTIHFETNGGSSVNDLTKPYGSTIVEPEAPIREGFEFVGWFSNEALTVPYIFTTMQSKNITVYAKWENINQEILYKVEYYLENLDGTGYTLEESYELYGSVNSVVTAQEMSYYGFIYNGNAVGTVSSGTLVADESLVLKLYYDRKSYTLTMKLGNEYNDVILELKYGMPLPEVTREGYNFGGWYEDSYYWYKYYSNVMPAYDLTLYAKWAEKIVDGDIVEAEDATLYGSSRTEYSSYASGGRHVGFIDHQTGSGVRFDITKETDVIYLRYASVSSGYINIYIDGEKRGRIYLNSSGDFISAYKMVAITGLNLKEGSTLAFQYDGYSENVAINFDFIAYSLNTDQTIEVVTLQQPMTTN